MSKKVKDWNEFILEQQNIENSQYSIFDIDDNLLIMNTPLYFQHFENGKWINKDISIQDFSKIRLEYPDNYIDNNEWKSDTKYTFSEFGDNGPRLDNSLVDDIKKSIKNKNFGPSWESFLTTLKEGRLFAIITTRGHEPNTIHSSVRYIIDNVLDIDDKNIMITNIEKYNKLFKFESTDKIENYLDCCYFIGLMSQAFKDEFYFTPTMKTRHLAIQDATNKFSNYVKEISPGTIDSFISNEKSLDFPEFYSISNSVTNKTEQVKVKI